MAYAALNSPLPNLTVSPQGCHSCGMRGLRGLGDDSTPIFDTTSTDPGDLIDPTVPVVTPDLAPVDISALPASNVTSTSIDALYPATVGTEFVSNGDGTYTNIQTGQAVPYATAQQVTNATTGAATANLDTTATQGTVTLTDPNTGVTSTVAMNNLTPAAQALNAAGQLVTAAGKLTAQGAARFSAGNFYNALPAAPSSLSTAMSSLTTWMSGSTMIAGVPNAVILLGLIGGVFMLSSMGGKKRR